MRFDPKKSLSLLVSVAYFATHVVMAAPMAKPPLLPLPLPASLSFPSLRTRLPSADVVLIQDVHQNQEAQKSIADLLLSIGDKKWTVGVEGLFGATGLERFQAFEDKGLLKLLADYFLHENKISAAGYVAAVADKPSLTFVGVDDAAHYRANVEAVRQAQKIKPAILTQVEGAQAHLQHVKASALNRRLAEFDQKKTAHEANELGLGDYISFLVRTSARHDDLTIEQFLAAYELERTLSFDRVEHERNRVMQTLAEKLRKNDLEQLVAQGLLYKAGQISFGRYIQTIKNLLDQYAVSLLSAPSFRKYLRYALLTENISAEKLNAGVRELETSLLNSLCQTPYERALMEQSRRLYLTRQLLNFALTPEEWEEYRETPPSLPTLQRGGEYPFEQFYREADARSVAMVKNLLATKAKVLIAGGFHSPLIKKLLQGQGFSVATVQPKITKVDSRSGTEYLSVFTREKSKLDQLFEGEKLFLAPDTTSGNNQMVTSAALYSQLRGMRFDSDLARVRVEPRAKGLFKVIADGKTYLVSTAKSLFGRSEKMSPPSLLVTYWKRFRSLQWPFRVQELALPFGPTIKIPVWVGIFSEPLFMTTLEGGAGNYEGPKDATIVIASPLGDVSWKGSAQMKRLADHVAPMDVEEARRLIIRSREGEVDSQVKDAGLWLQIWFAGLQHYASLDTEDQEWFFGVHHKFLKETLAESLQRNSEPSVFEAPEMRFYTLTRLILIRQFVPQENEELAEYSKETIDKVIGVIAYVLEKANDKGRVSFLSSTLEEGFLSLKTANRSLRKDGLDLVKNWKEWIRKGIKEKKRAFPSGSAIEDLDAGNKLARAARTTQQYVSDARELKVALTPRRENPANWNAWFHPVSYLMGRINKHRIAVVGFENWALSTASGDVTNAMSFHLRLIEAAANAGRKQIVLADGFEHMTKLYNSLRASGDEKTPQDLVDIVQTFLDSPGDSPFIPFLGASDNFFPGVSGSQEVRFWEDLRTIKRYSGLTILVFGSSQHQKSKKETKRQETYLQWLQDPEKDLLIFSDDWSDHLPADLANEQVIRIRHVSLFSHSKEKTGAGSFPEEMLAIIKEVGAGENLTAALPIFTNRALISWFEGSRNSLKDLYDGWRRSGLEALVVTAESGSGDGDKVFDDEPDPSDRVVVPSGGPRFSMLVTPAARTAAIEVLRRLGNFQTEEFIADFAAEYEKWQVFHWFGFGFYFQHTHRSFSQAVGIVAIYIAMIIPMTIAYFMAATNNFEFLLTAVLFIFGGIVAMRANVWTHKQYNRLALRKGWKTLTTTDAAGSSDEEPKEVEIVMTGSQGSFPWNVTKKLSQFLELFHANSSPGQEKKTLEALLDDKNKRKTLDTFESKEELAWWFWGIQNFSGLSNDHRQLFSTWVASSMFDFLEGAHLRETRIKIFGGKKLSASQNWEFFTYLLLYFLLFQQSQESMNTKLTEEYQNFLASVIALCVGVIDDENLRGIVAYPREKLTEIFRSLPPEQSLLRKDGLALVGNWEKWVDRGANALQSYDSGFADETFPEATETERESALLASILLSKSLIPTDERPENRLWWDSPVDYLVRTLVGNRMVEFSTLEIPADKGGALSELWKFQLKWLEAMAVAGYKKVVFEQGRLYLSSIYSWLLRIDRERDIEKIMQDINGFLASNTELDLGTYLGLPVDMERTSQVNQTLHYWEGLKEIKKKHNLDVLIFSDLRAANNVDRQQMDRMEAWEKDESEKVIFFRNGFHWERSRPVVRIDQTYASSHFQYDMDIFDRFMAASLEPYMKLDRKHSIAIPLIGNKLLEKSAKIIRGGFELGLADAIKKNIMAVVAISESPPGDDDEDSPIFAPTPDPADQNPLPVGGGAPTQSGHASLWSLFAVVFLMPLASIFAGIKDDREIQIQEKTQLAQALVKVTPVVNLGLNALRASEANLAQLNEVDLLTLSLLSDGRALGNADIKTQTTLLAGDATDPRFAQYLSTVQRSLKKNQTVLVFAPAANHSFKQQFPQLKFTNSLSTHDIKRASGNSGLTELTVQVLSKNAAFLNETVTGDLETLLASKDLNVKMFLLVLLQNVLVSVPVFAGELTHLLDGKFRRELLAATHA